MPFISININIETVAITSHNYISGKISVKYWKQLLFLTKDNFSGNPNFICKVVKKLIFNLLFFAELHLLILKYFCRRICILITSEIANARNLMSIWVHFPKCSTYETHIFRETHYFFKSSSFFFFLSKINVMCHNIISYVAITFLLKCWRKKIYVSGLVIKSFDTILWWKISINEENNVTI